MLKSPRRLATEASPDKRKNHILCPSSRRIQVYTPTSRYSISYLANTALGRGDPGPEPFRSIQAVKVDYTSKSFNLSVNASHTADSRPAFGGYFQATVSDALLVY